MMITDNYHYDDSDNADDDEEDDNDDDDDDDDVRNVSPSMYYHQHRTESKI